MERKRTLSIIFGAIVLVLAFYVISPPAVKSYVANIAVTFNVKSN
jgi:hypothetical protein